MTDTALARVDSQMRALAIPKDANAIYGIAESMHKAGLVPTSIKSIECAFLAMMKGAEYGLLPQQALAGFYVIGNIAHPYGTCLNGIVKAAQAYVDEIEGCVEGLAEMRYLASEPNEYPAGSPRHAMFAELQRDLRRRLARVEEKIGKAKEPPAYFCGWSVMVRKDCEPVCMLFDTFDANRGELTGKGMWSKWPTRMYMHRAATFNRRDTFGDALMGLEATYEEIMDNAADLGTQPPPQQREPGGGPTSVIHNLSQPRTPASAPITVHADPVAPPAARPPPVTDATARAEIYASSPAPTSDIPMDSDEPLNPEEAKAAASRPRTPPPGATALKQAIERVRAAGLDPAAVGKQAIEGMMGEGVSTKDLSDKERGDLAVIIHSKVDAARNAPPPPPVEREPGDEPDEDETHF